MKEVLGMLMLEIKVTPCSGRSELVIDKQGRLKAFLKSPPENGKANKELITLLSKSLKCPQARITIITGTTNRNKTLKLDVPLSYDEVLVRLGLSHQTSLLG